MNRFRKLTYYISIVLIVALIITIQIYSSKQDKLSPVINFKDEIITVSVFDGDDVLLEGVSAIDDRDGDLTDSISIEQLSDFNDDGSRTITYAVSDSSNNITKTSRNVKYSDYEAPKFNLSASPTFYSSDSNINIATLLMATDVFDGNISTFIKIIDDNIIIGQGGTYYATISVYNSAGDNETIKLPVIIEPASSNSASPNINLKEHLVYFDKGAEKPDWNSYVESLQVRSNSSVTTTSAGALTKIKIDDTAVDLDKTGCYYVNYEYTNSNDLTGVSRLIIVVR